jgi:hypothetical protein
VLELVMMQLLGLVVLLRLLLGVSVANTPQVDIST